MSDLYERFLIKEYRYWSIYLHENQSYLGKCVVWCKREDAFDLTQAASEEREELFVALNELKDAATRAFQPDWFNYSFLGNETRHLHGHFVPRYSRSVEFGGVVFKDDRWGHNYRTDHSFKIPDETLQMILAEMKRAIRK